MPKVSRPQFITDAKHIKSSLRSARVGCGINQTEFAKIMGKSQGWVSQVENGEINFPSMMPVGGMRIATRG